MKSCFIFLFVISFCVAQSDLFAYYSQQILTMRAQPQKHVEQTVVLIDHPLIKDKNVVLEHKSDLVWKNRTVTRVIRSFKQKRGKQPIDKSLKGMKGPFLYPDNDLKKVCITPIANWKSSRSLLGKKEYSGFTFLFVDRKIQKKGEIMINTKGNIVALCVKNRVTEGKKNSFTWYFEGDNKNLRLVKSIKIETKESNGVPTTKKTTQRFNKF